MLVIQYLLFLDAGEADEKDVSIGRSVGPHQVLRSQKKGWHHRVRGLIVRMRKMIVHKLN